MPRRMKRRKRRRQREKLLVNGKLVRTKRGERRIKKRKGKEPAGQEEEASEEESSDDDQENVEGREIITRSKSQKNSPEKRKGKKKRANRGTGIVIREENREGQEEEENEEEEEEEEEPLVPKKRRRITLGGDREEGDRIEGEISAEERAEIDREIDEVANEETGEGDEGINVDEPDVNTPLEMVYRELFTLPTVDQAAGSSLQGDTSQSEGESEPEILEEYEKDTFKVYLPCASMIREAEKKPEKEAGIFNRALLKVITPAHMKKSTERLERSLRKAADILTDCARIVNKAGEDWGKKEGKKKKT